MVVSDIYFSRLKLVCIFICICSYGRCWLFNKELEHAGILLRRPKYYVQTVYVQLDTANYERRRLACDGRSPNDGLLQGELFGRFSVLLVTISVHISPQLLYGIGLIYRLVCHWLYSDPKIDDLE